MSNKTNHPKKYVRWDDWEAWKLKEWNPLAHNDFPHMKTNVSWLIRLMIGLWFTFIAGVIAIIVMILPG